MTPKYFGLSPRFILNYLKNNTLILLTNRPYSYTKLQTAVFKSRFRIAAILALLTTGNFKSVNTQWRPASWCSHRSLRKSVSVCKLYGYA